MTTQPGNGPLFVAGDDTGVLVCHGFCGSGLSVRPWAEHAAAAGHTVAMPLLPGHGTQWQDLERTLWQDWYNEAERRYRDLAAQCARVFVFGFSMGAALSLRLAAQFPDGVAGLVLVNPSVGSRRPGVRLLSFAPVLRRIIRTSSGIGGDTKTPDAPRQTGYDRVPTRAAYELIKLWRTARAELPSVIAPTLLFRSRVDHVVDALSAKLIRVGLRNAHLEEQVLENSYHNACLDNDAAIVFAGSEDWIARYGLASTGSAQTPMEDGA